MEPAKKIAPSNIHNLLQNLESFGTQMFQLRESINHKLETHSAQLDATDCNSLQFEQQYHYEQLQIRHSSLQRQSMNLIQETIAEMITLQTKLSDIESELTQDLSKWKFWDEECPICMRRIRLETGKNYQTMPCCMKLFHTSCLNSHYRERKPTTCPSCRHEAINYHPLYKYGTNNTPVNFRKYFASLTNEQFKREFQSLSSHQFREAFDSWSNITQRNLPQRITDIVERQITQFKAQLQEE